jgi:hypothetical protein
MEQQMQFSQGHHLDQINTKTNMGARQCAEGTAGQMLPLHKFEETPGWLGLLEQGALQPGKE